MSTGSLAAALEGARLDGEIVSTGHDSYEAARRIWNGVADRRPAAIVRAGTDADVAKTVRVAAERDLLLAVRCGGHSLPGFSTCDGGIVLDLARLNAVAVDPAARIVRVGGGALLGDLDRAGAPHGLVVPAGVVSHTGVAGLTLGGGMGWLSRRYGLSIDSLVGVDLVTADGRTLHASATEEPELFWGLRGGGGNFGVVTRFTFRMHPLGPVAVGKWQYPAAAREAVIRRFHTQADKAARTLTAACTVTADGVTITVCWSGPEAEAASALAPFGALAPGAEGGHGPADFVRFQSRSDEAFRWGRRYYSKGGFFGDLDGAVISGILDAIASVPTPDSEIHLLQLGGAVADVAEDATAYSGRAGKYYWIAEPVWDDPAEDDRCIGWGRQTGTSLAAVSMRGNYVNEQADAGAEVAAGAYGPEKYRRLQRLKARFDPGNLFRLNQNIAPLA